MKKEGLIKKVSIDNFTLEHTRYYDDFGIPHEMFDLIEFRPDREIKFMHKPMFPPIKASNYDKNTSISEMCNDYSEEEMLEVLKVEISKEPPRRRGLSD